MIYIYIVLYIHMFKDDQGKDAVKIHIPQGPLFWGVLSLFICLFVGARRHLVVAELAVGISRSLGLGRPRWSCSSGHDRPRRQSWPCPRGS